MSRQEISQNLLNVEMIENYFHKKITLCLGFLILNNYLLLSLSFSTFVLKINFTLFIITLLLFYFKNFKNNIYLKIFLLLIILISLGVPVFEWDARSIWLFHAKRIFFDNSIFSISDNYAVFSHNDYPSVGPAFASSLAILFGFWNEVLPKLAFTLLYLPPLIFTYTILREDRYLIFLSLVFFIIGKQLFSGLADGLIAIYFCLSAYLMYDLIINTYKSANKKIINYLISLIFFTTLTLIKNEGLVLLLILFFSTVTICLFKKKILENLLAITFLSSSFVPILLWKYFCYSNGIVNEHINSNFVVNLIPRLKEFNNYVLIFKFFILNEKFLLSLLFFIISFWFKWNKTLLSFVTSALGFYFLVILLIFLATPVDFYFQLNSSAARIVKTLSFSLGFFALYNLSSKNLLNNRLT